MNSTSGHACLHVISKMKRAKCSATAAAPSCCASSFRRFSASAFCRSSSIFFACSSFFAAASFFAFLIFDAAAIRLAAYRRLA